MSAPGAPRTRVLLSFSDAYVELAQRVAADLRSAHIDVRYDSWTGGGGVPATQAVPADVSAVACVVPVLTPSDAVATWIGDEWKRTIHDQAIAAGVPVFPARGDVDLAAVPAFLKEKGSIADLRDDEYPHELRRLVETIRERSGDVTIALPEDPEAGGTAQADAPDAQPLVVEFDGALAEALGGGSGAAFAAQIPMMLDGLFYSTGVAFPAPDTRLNAELPASSFRIVINGVPEFQAGIRPGSVLVNGKVPALTALGFDAVEVENPASRAKSAWIAAAHAAAAREAGFTTWDPAQFVILSLSEVLRRKAADFIGVEEAQAMLGAIEPVFPLLVTETVPKTVPLFVFTDVLRRLTAELVSIRDLRRILLTLADWGRFEQDPMMLTEYVRASLTRQISDYFSCGQNDLPVLLLDPAIEREIGDAITITPTASYVNIEPVRLRQILDAIKAPVQSLSDDARVPPILTTLEIRASVRRLVAPVVPRLGVMSYQEVWPAIAVQPVGRISLDGVTPRPGVTTFDGKPLWPEQT